MANPYGPLGDAVGGMLDATGGIYVAVTAAKASLAVSPVSVSVPYGTAIPALTYAITGFVDGDKPGVVTGAPTETTTAKAGSKVGSYPITLGMGTLAAANYTFLLGSGTVTVTSLGVTAEPKVTQTVTIAEATAGATVYFTLNGTTPTMASKIYTGPLTITASEVVKSIAVAPGYDASPVRTVTDTVQ